MTDQIACSYVFDQIQSLFATRDDLAEVRFKFGWREPDKRAEGMVKRKLTFVPGDTGGKLGRLNMAKWPGATETSARPLGSLDELMTVYCYALNELSIEDEKSQYVAARLLFDDFYAALWRVMHGQFRVDDLVYSHISKERRTGAEIRALVVLQARLPDVFDDSVLTSADKATGVIEAPNDPTPYEVSL